MVSFYNGVPTLAAGRQLRAVEASMPPLDTTVSSSAEADATTTVALDWKARLAKQLSVASCWESWMVYVRQDVALPGFALALLYFTVLR